MSANITNANFTGTTIFATNLESVIVYPNPCKSETITFNNLTKNAIITIYNITGEKIKEIKAENADATYNLKNENDNSIASGVYIYYISDDKDHKRIGKFAVIKGK